MTNFDAFTIALEWVFDFIYQHSVFILIPITFSMSLLCIKLLSDVLAGVLCLLLPLLLVPGLLLLLFLGLLLQLLLLFLLLLLFAVRAVQIVLSSPILASVTNHVRSMALLLVLSAFMFPEVKLYDYL